jgi:hypothetical protein
VTCRPISRQRPNYVHTTIEPALQEVFSVWLQANKHTFLTTEEVFSVWLICPLLGNGPINMHSWQQKKVFCMGSMLRAYLEDSRCYSQ